MKKLLSVLLSVLLVCGCITCLLTSPASAETTDNLLSGYTVDNWTANNGLTGSDYFEQVTESDKGGYAFKLKTPDYRAMHTTFALEANVTYKLSFSVKSNVLFSQLHIFPTVTDESTTVYENQGGVSWTAISNIRIVSTAWNLNPDKGYKAMNENFTQNGQEITQDWYRYEVTFTPTKSTNYDLAIKWAGDMSTKDTLSVNDKGEYVQASGSHSWNNTYATVILSDLTLVKKSSLSVETVGNGAVTSTAGADVYEGDKVTLKATPYQDAEFLGWYDKTTDKLVSSEKEYKDFAVGTSTGLVAKFTGVNLLDGYTASNWVRNGSYEVSNPNTFKQSEVTHKGGYSTRYAAANYNHAHLSLGTVEEGKTYRFSFSMASNVLVYKIHMGYDFVYNTKGATDWTSNEKNIFFLTQNDASPDVIKAVAAVMEKNTTEITSANANWYEFDYTFTAKKSGRVDIYFNFQNDYGAGDANSLLNAGKSSFIVSDLCMTKVNTITVTGGKADYEKSSAGKTISIKADVPEDQEFDKWECVSGGVTFADATAKDTTFVMPDNDVSVKAVLKTRPVTAVTIADDDFELTTPAATKTLTATVTPSNATNKTIKFKSDDENVATVDATGKVTAVANGTATITAYSDEDNAILDTVKVTVNIPHICAGTKTAAKAPTCKADGNKEYYTCECGKWYEDEACTKEITDKTSVTLASDGKHSESEDWTTDDTNHWKTCAYEDCGAVIESTKAAHADKDNDGKCDTCGFEMAKEDNDSNKDDGDDNNTSDEETFITVKETEDVKVEATENTFESGTEVFVDPITEGEEYDNVESALKDYALKFTAFDIYAEKDGVKVQPDGTVKVTFAIPEGYDASKVVVLYVAEDGKVEVIPSVVSEDGTTVTATLEHFSTYVVAEASEGLANGEVGGSDESPVTGDYTNVWAFVAVMFAAAFGVVVFARRKVRG